MHWPVDQSVRRDPQFFSLPDIKERGMHRVVQGPDGNIPSTRRVADVAG